MTIAERRRQIVETYRTHEGDSGSSQIQVALLTERINSINEHMKLNKKDFGTQRGLLKLVGRRNRLLKYLRRTQGAKYRELIASLGLRK